MKNTPVSRATKLTLLLPVLLIVSHTGSLLIAGEGDRDAIVEKTTMPSFPRDLLSRGVDAGKAKVLIQVDAEGKLVDALCIEALYPEIGEVLVRAIKQWKFTPPTRNGKPVPFMKELELDLTTGWNIKTVTAMDFVFSDRSPGTKEPRYRAYSLKELDRIPKPLAMAQPSYPQDLRDAGIAGKVLVNFYIDETGAVRLPEIKQSATPELDFIALDTITQWKFEPPIRGGKPALVKAVQSFVFDPAKATKKETPEPKKEAPETKK
ncbi:MAG: energy transducer TonB [Verrucomicrobiota bacterium]|nr:energy transducer TonB [Verrucomicrobiota bacterium]